MKITSVYPVLLSNDVTEAAAFFQDHFGYEAVFATDWYISLRLGAYELAVLAPEHETIPEAWRGVSAAGMLLNIEVEDVDAVYERLVTNGPLEAAQELRSEVFGQRHFIVAGPEGVLVDVITPIEMDPAFVEESGTAAII